MCFMQQALRAASLSTEDESLHLKSAIKAAELISELDITDTPPETATGIFRSVAEITLNPDGFKEVKSIANKKVTELLPWASDFIKTAENPLSAALNISLSGNIIDHGIFDSFDIESVLKKEVTAPLDSEAVSKFRSIISGSKDILFMADNSGEIGFDRLLIEEIVKLNPELNLTVFVRSKPVINDATREDADFFGIGEFADILETPPDVGVEIERLNGSAREAVEGADWIISKGQANFERLSELNGHSIVFLLRAKCRVVAEHLGVKINSPVIRIVG